MIKCSWCDNKAIYAGWNMRKLSSLKIKETDIVDEKLTTRYACDKHKDNLKQWVETND